MLLPWVAVEQNTVAMGAFPPFTGTIACLYMTCSYVGALYLIPADVRRKPRDDPVHVRAVIF